MPRSSRLLRASCVGAALLFSALAISGCSSTSVQPNKTALAGTHWQLASIQSMDDAQGTTRIPDTKLFTLQFEESGKAFLRLDCNRGQTDWRVENSTPENGQLRFGPVTSTRALCPPPHLDERVARDLSHVRSYRLKDGKLYLSLEADGGIYEWILQTQ